MAPFPSINSTCVPSHSYSHDYMADIYVYRINFCSFLKFHLTSQIVIMKSIKIRIKGVETKYF